MKISSFLIALVSFTGLATGLLIYVQYPVAAGTLVDDLASMQAIPYLAAFIALATVMAVLSLWSRLRWLALPSWLTLLAATGLAGGIKLTHIWEAHQLLPPGSLHFGMSNLYEVTQLLIYIQGAVGLYFTRDQLRYTLAVAILLVLNMAFLLWLGSLGVGGPQALVPALQSYWLPWHVFTNFVAYACFFLAGAAGVWLLLSRSLETQQLLGRWIDRLVQIGFPVFTIAILLGAIWANEAWGGYWSWDPKETWALIVWLIYAAYLHAQHLPRFTLKQRAWWGIIGFIATLVCYLGVNMFMDGLHSYGSLG